MRRSLFVGAVWLLVTGVSILVAYAAVGEVRNRVVEQPRLIPVAATTVAPTPTSDTTISTTTTTLGVTSTSPDTTTSTHPVVQTTVTLGTATTSTPTTRTTEHGTIETYSTPGGSVSIEVFSDRLRLLGAVPAAGYSVAEQEIAPTRIEIEFTSSAQEVKFHAELHSDGEVETQVEVENQ